MATANIIAPGFTHQHVIFDNTSLYAKGWYLVLLRQMVLELNNGYAPDWLGPGDNFVRRLWTADDAGPLFLRDTDSGSFIVDVQGWSDSELNCLAHIARAGVMMNRQAEMENPVAARVLWFPVRICAYRTNQWLPEVFAIADFTPEAMINVLRKLSSQRKEEQDWTGGFYKAASVFNTVIKQTGQRTDVFTCTAELMYKLVWDRPAASNFLWDVLGFKKVEQERTYHESEVGVLRNTTAMEMLRMGVIIGGLFSLGIGLALTRQNVSGATLNAMRTQNPISTRYSQLREAVFQRRAMRGVAEIYNYMAREVASFTSATIPVGIFRGPGWCNGLRTPGDGKAD